jgi:hypothetical protein
MRIDQFCTRVRAHLLREGVFGRRAERYVEELREHAQLLTAQIAAGGHPNVEAEEIALQHLGQPDLLARQEAVELRSKSWWYRHPWLANFTLYMGATVACALLEFIILLGFHFLYPKDLPPPGDEVSAYTLSAVCNYGPLLMGLYFLLWFGRRFGCSWGTLLVVAVMVGLACTNLNSRIYHVPRHIHSYSMDIELGPVPSTIDVILEYILRQDSGLGHTTGWKIITGTGYPQLLTPILFVVIWWRGALWRTERELAQVHAARP